MALVFVIQDWACHAWNMWGVLCHIFRSDAVANIDCRKRRVVGSFLRVGKDGAIFCVVDTW